MTGGSGTRQNDQLFIRPMMQSDLDSVLRVEGLSFPHPWSREQFIYELGREPYSRCQVAEAEGGMGSQESILPVTGAVVGFIMAWLVADELHITNLAVAPEARRSGVAAALLESAIREAMDLGAAWCQLEVRASNTAARGLYRRYGFKPLGTRKSYYQDGEDAVVMGKELGSS